MANLSKDIINLMSVLTDKLRTEWSVIDIDITAPDKPIIEYKELKDYNIEDEEALELGYWEFISGTGYVWRIVLEGLAYDITSLGTFRMNNVDLVDLSLVTSVRNKKPYFYHGTPIDLNKELDTAEATMSNALYPAVILWEVIRQNFDADKTQNLGNTPVLTISFLDTTNKLDWTTDEQYENVVDPMELLADKFIKICENRFLERASINPKFIGHQPKIL